MCGIAGFFGFEDTKLIKQFSKDLKHRGPDGEGFYLDKNISLLNRRLAIIDRKTGDQPMYNSDKSLVVVYNGEIYNFRELRAQLEVKGFKFKTQSDTEVIVQGYQAWGEELFAKLNGMFAIALYQTKQRRLTLVRDHFGIKPLYFGSTKKNGKHQFLFASEITPLINSGYLKKTPNDRTIYRYLRFRIHDDGRETFFKGIERLLPGELMVIDQKAAIKRIYSPIRTELNRDNGPYGEAARNQFKKLLHAAVKRHLISDVPVGTCLSGGLDSSTIVSVANQLISEQAQEASSLGTRQQTFSAVFPNSTNNEESYVDELLNELKNVKGHKIYPKADEFFSDIEEFVRTQEEPTISTGPYAQFKVMQEVKKHVTVVLDGQGADEMLAGYVPYYFVYLRQLKKEAKWASLMWEVLRSMDVVAPFVREKIKKRFGFSQNVEPNQLLNKAWRKNFSDEKFLVVQDNLKLRLIEDIFKNSLPSLLRYEDKNAMHFSVEGRVPFLDKELVSYALNLEPAAIIKDGWNKNILRASFSDRLPGAIAKRRNKIGFTTPEYEWFLRLKNRIYGVFLSESFGKRKYFNQAEVLKNFEGFIRGKNTDTLLFWRFLNLELWLRYFFDKPEPATIPRGILQPNKGKQLEIGLDQQKFLRFPVFTDRFKNGDNVFSKIIQAIQPALKQIKAHKKYGVQFELPWWIVVSEKVVAIAQGRSYFIWDIKTGWWAKTLARFVTKTPFGIGLGSAWTMQLAIQEAGLLRILFAALGGALTKPLGLKGMFYRLAGSNVRAIDGPTEYSLYPSNVSAKLPPKNPQQVAGQIHQNLRTKLPKSLEANFKGVVIIDANDLGCNVLGNTTGEANQKLETIFKDNPLGQATEQTPVAIVLQK